MVNKSDGGFAAIYGDTSHHIVRIVPLADIHQGVAIHNGEILHVESVNGVDVCNDLVVSLLQGVGLGIVNTGLESLVDIRCNGSLVGGEQGVAA